MSNFYQYVSCPTRLNKTIDLCYGSVKGAYKSVALPPLGSSDHNTILLTPTYKPLLKRGKIVTREVEMWTDNAVEELKGALESTDWNVFNNSTTLDERVDVISSYILYLKDLIIPTKCVKVFPNNKPRLNKAVKDALHRKQHAFLCGDVRDKAEAKKEARYEIKRAKLQYKNRIEGKFHSNDLKAEEVDHGPVVEDCVEWCDNHFLKLNGNKTKDMVIDFRKTSHSIIPTTVKGSLVELVESHKYLGTVIDNKLNHDLNTSAVCKKGLQRLYFLRRLNIFNVDKTLMALFYKSFIESILTFSLISWYGNLTVQNKNSLSNIVKLASKIIGTQQLSLTNIYERQL
ncbi:hypothetical protein N1851_026972 [Merluccius polli]|uniref:Alkylated DNA repair protein AlkB homologue 8 N-terminal domain-containing protein n=1 Tax=Merluccius polli TaxID=89951 RepID=A0AA47MAS3_MERPO|nr:hypothetical protein N1851_026972 [Merluccius polli]